VSRAYYNENDPRAAAWLRELIKEGHIAPGDVDERSIEDVTPNDLKPYTQCHFFAGIGGWSYALRLAGWPDDRAIWTGSCPCQPFSLAGARKGFADKRHLWPIWFDLIQQCDPTVICGEQVAGKAALDWLDVVFADLEGEMYSCAAADLCAAAIGAPHIRQRLYWVAISINAVAHASGERLEVFSEQQARRELQAIERSGASGVLGHAGGAGGGRYGGGIPATEESSERQVWSQSDELVVASELGDPNNGRPSEQTSRQKHSGSIWRDCGWIRCRDGKSRPVEPGTFPLAHGVPERVGLLRGYGNAIVTDLASAFIEATGLV